MHLDTNKIWLSAKDYVIIVVGIAMYSFGFCAFIYPEQTMMGGMAGLSQLVYYTSERSLGFGIPMAITMYIGNILLLIMAWRTVGRTFVIRTIFGATVISIFVGIMQPFFSQPIIEQQTFMNIVIGAIICGIGIGWVFVHNGSTGGTDIVAAMVSKRTNVSVGRTMQMCDFCIITSSFLIFGEIDKVVYGFVVLFIVTFVADQMITTNRQAVQFTIFSEKWEEIATAVNNLAHRGCTIIDGMGWYSKRPMKVLLVMCRKIESVTIFRIIKSIDKDAFITQARVNGVYGKGFDELKLKMKMPKPDEDRDSTLSNDSKTTTGIIP